MLHQEALGFTPAGEQHNPVAGVLAAPAPVVADQLEQLSADIEY
jgi:hypothetical protein